MDFDLLGACSCWNRWWGGSPSCLILSIYENDVFLVDAGAMPHSTSILSTRVGLRQPVMTMLKNGSIMLHYAVCSICSVYLLGPLRNVR